MEPSTSTTRMLRYACSKSELSCIIGNLFTELTTPCGLCNEDEVIITGRTYEGEEVRLIILEDGFLFDGEEDLISNITQRRCINIERNAAKSAIGTQRDYESKRSSKTHFHSNK